MAYQYYTTVGSGYGATQALMLHHRHQEHLLSRYQGGTSDLYPISGTLPDITSDVTVPYKVPYFGCARTYPDPHGFSGEPYECRELLEEGMKYEGTELCSQMADRPAIVQDGDTYILADQIVSPFEKDAKIGIEATAYLQRLIDENGPAHEPLLAALGGDPIALKKNIHAELDLWKENQMIPVFIFEGQSMVGKEETAFFRAKKALERTQDAWNTYADNHPEEAVKSFGSSSAIRPADLYRILQQVLIERNVEFQTAPFSACAQLAHLEALDTQYIDGVMGSLELLLYGIHDGILFPPSASNWEKKEFVGVSKTQLLTRLNATPEHLTNMLLMTGTSFLPTFPPLHDPTIIQNQPPSVNDAANLLRTSNKSVTATCAGFSDILQRTEPNWLDKFRKAKMAIKHCIVINESGVVSVNAYDFLTKDNPEYLGLQLPSELQHYLSKMIIGPRLCNIFGSLEFRVFPTLDGVLSDEYKRLVTKSLPPLTSVAAALISARVNRVFQYKDIPVRYWFDGTLQDKLLHRNEQPQANSKADTWGILDAQLKARESAIGLPAGRLSFAAVSLQDKNFSSNSIAKAKVSNLNSKTEVLSSALYRLLHLRGYINDQHELTNWGTALAATLESISPIVKKFKDIHHAEEAAFLAFELIRFDNLNARNRHSELIGGPLRGSDEEKASCILVGRTACLLKVRHREIGYTGPLSKNFLAFHSAIKAVREANRDILEAITASMFLSGQANKTRSDDEFYEIAQSLPFSTDVDTALGIAVKTYLDDFLKPDTPSDQPRASTAEYAEKYLPHSINFPEDLDVAFKFFDAVYDGVRKLGEGINDVDKNAWESAKTYLDKKR